MNNFLVFVGVLSVVSSQAFGSKAANAAAPAQFDSLGQPVYIDATVSDTDRASLKSDYSFIGSRELKTTPNKTSVYSYIFGGESGQAAQKYLNDRVHYFLGSLENKDFQKRFKVSASTLNDDAKKSNSTATLMATNIGTVAYFISKTVVPSSMFFSVAGKDVRVESSRIGLVELGPGYSGDKFGAEERVGTLIHEARHSDCTGGLDSSDIDLIAKGESPVNNSCGHTHVLCPAGHDLAGLPACDSEAWGAYSIGMIYGLELSQNCKNCTATQKQVFGAQALDSASRVLVLQDMAAGKLGAPDMSSSD